jgi:hypothetical protein
MGISNSEIQLILVDAAREIGESENEIVDGY